MPSNFPSGPDTIVNNVNNTTPEQDTHPGVHNQLADSVMAVQVSLLAGGSLSLADHKTAADPHPVYLTQAEGDARYTLTTAGVTWPLQAPDGTASAPSYSFSTQSGLGIYRVGAGQLGVTGHLRLSTDNTYDIGASGANRPRNVYVGSQVQGMAGGSAAAPTYSFQSDTSTGFWVAAGGAIAVANQGANSVLMQPTNFRLTSSMQLGWTSGDALVALDTILVRDAANTLAQRNGTNPQQMRFYETYTDASNYSRLIAGWEAGYAYLRVESAGTGLARDLILTSNTNRSIYFQVGNGGNVWRIDGPTKAFLAAADNTYDIGASGANRPRNVYVGGNIYAAATAVTQSQLSTQSTPTNLFGGTGAPGAFGANGDFYFRADTPATANQRLYVKSAGAWVGIV